MSAETKETIPEQSPSDPRNYKIITLPNKLECIIVSDPDAEKGACALCVQVGHLADPDILPGLAHFLEHMLFLGSKKYPKEGGYKQFIKDHGGRSNASTATHQTCFQFDIGSDYLAEAVDRLAQFFISPLFTESAADRELNAVNSENSNNQQNDARRFYQFEKSLANAAHPFHKFGTGNINTLREDVPNSIDVRQELLSFHAKYYSSSIMKLAIVGKEDIDTLADMVDKMFSAVVNKNVSEPQYSDDVYDTNTFPMLYKLLPIKERRELRLTWIMDSCYEYTLSRPTRLLAYCMGDECKGSVLSYLKELGYATGLSAGCCRSLPEFAGFRCTVKLTPRGLVNWQEIVGIIYQYICKMKLVKDERWRMYFEERAKVKLMNFNFKGKEKSYSYARGLARSLHRNYPREKFLKCYRSLLFKYDYKLIAKYLSFFTVDNCYYQLIAKDFKDSVDEKEKWYGTQYKKEEIEEKVLEEWRQCNANQNDKLFTPEENKYIADDFSIFCDENKEENKQESKDDEYDPPIVIDENSKRKIWFKMDKIFKKPKLCINIKIYSSLYNILGAESMNLTGLIMMIFNDELSDLTYAFEEASLRYSASYNYATAIVFKFSGYNQKLHLLTETVLKKFKNLKITKEKYEIQKELLQRSITSMKKEQPYSHCRRIDSLFLTPKTVNINDLEQSLKKITYDKVVEHFAKIYEKIYVEALIYGNINIESVKNIYVPIIDENITKQMKEEYALKELFNDNKGCLRLLSNNNYCVSFECPNVQDKNSCISTHFLCKLDDKTGKNFAPLKLFAHLCNAPCFSSLRTEQQLGYIVWSYCGFIRGLYTFRIIIQSNNSCPPKLNYRIELFLQKFKETILSMDDKIFETNKESVINNLLEKTKTIREENGVYWTEISLFRYQFNRRKNLANNIKLLTKNDILLFYNQYISNENENENKRCKLTIQCFGNQHSINYNNDDDGDEAKEQSYNDNNVIHFEISNVNQIRQKYGYHSIPYNGKL